MNSAQINPNEPHLVVAGAFGTRPKLDVDPTFGTDDEWGEYILTVVDNAPEAMDFATIETLAQLDAEEGVYHPPTPYDPASYDRYVRRWNDTWAKTNNRTLLR